ncbi:MAG: hypothetical protein JKY98_01610 [Gammaproteobacteria bacterium]|nr:hypothetical protein [Gammaproteobacteria bacterium]
MRLKSLLLVAALLFILPAWGQTTYTRTNPADWNGTWIAEGTLFSIAVSVINNEFTIKEVQSLGFVWTAKPGRVDGNMAAVEISYAGATAKITVELTGTDSAIASASNCMPEFMLACALTKGRQAVFRRSDNQ